MDFFMNQSPSGSYEKMGRIDDGKYRQLRINSLIANRNVDVIEN
jgi:hypothetical protein